MAHNRSFSNRLADFTLGKPGAPATITTVRGSEFYDDIVYAAREENVMLRLKPTIISTLTKEDLFIPVISKDTRARSTGNYNRKLALGELSIPMRVSDAVAQDTYIDLRDYFVNQAGYLLAGQLRWLMTRAVKQCYDRKIAEGKTPGTVNLHNLESVDDAVYSVIAPYRVSASAGWTLPLDANEAAQCELLTPKLFGRYLMRHTGSPGKAAYDNAVLQYIGPLAWYGDWSQLFLRLHDTLTFSYDKHGMKLTGQACAQVIDDNGLTPFSVTCDA